MFVLNGLPPKLDGDQHQDQAVEVEHDLPYEPRNRVSTRSSVAFATPHRERYLVPFLQMNKVVEYDKDFNEIWRLQGQEPMGRDSAQERQHADHR